MALKCGDGGETALEIRRRALRAETGHKARVGWCGGRGGRSQRLWRRPKPRGPDAPVCASGGGLRRQCRTGGTDRQALPWSPERWGGLLRKCRGRPRNTAHRGSRGASLKHRARNAEGSGSPWQLSPVHLKPSCTGSWGACAPAFRAPSLISGRECELDYGRTWRPTKNTGGGALPVSSCPAQRGRGTTRRSRVVEGAWASRQASALRPLHHASHGLPPRCASLRGGG